MQTKIVEVTNHPTGMNWGKFLVGRFEPSEWAHPSDVGEHASILRARGWTDEHVLVLDLETGEGAIFRLGGVAKADLDKHNVWVCPMFEPFLTWLYKHPDFDALPAMVQLTEEEAPSSLFGYRRGGRADMQGILADPELRTELLKNVFDPGPDGTHIPEDAER